MLGLGEERFIQFKMFFSGIFKSFLEYYFFKMVDTGKTMTRGGSKNKAVLQENRTENNCSLQ